MAELTLISESPIGFRTLFDKAGLPSQDKRI